ncbi:alpha/beta hydrolase [Paenibacillus dauci]|uniref:alpha/beta hydrolase n=1 Tax=Paenibacillus dauci TaxID=1567106 RepID=UPI000619AAD5|nr:alpha/beta hydrolase [Paenibacillus dauci]
MNTEKLISSQENHFRKKRKLLKIFGIGLLFIAVLLITVVINIATHPTLAVIAIQKIFYSHFLGRVPNSFEPVREPNIIMKKNGIWYRNDLKYDSTYPNSYLDISYPDKNISVKRPTVLYIHGGGFFAGSKYDGDPLAIGTKVCNSLFDEIVLKGYNLVNIDYALAPEYHYPVPLIQLNQAIHFVKQHSKELGLDMKNVVIMGGSAGAVMTAQYGLIVTQKNYASALGIEPAISQDQIKALVIDDGPLKTKWMNWGTAAMIKNYFGTNDLDGEQGKQFDVASYVDGSYIPSFLGAGNTGSYSRDMQHLYRTLQEKDVDTEYYYRDQTYGELGHGFLIQSTSNQYAKEYFEQIMAFVGRHIE